MGQFVLGRSYGVEVVMVQTSTEFSASTSRLAGTAFSDGSRHVQIQTTSFVFVYRVGTD